MSKIKIGFEIEDTWNIEAFRNVINALNKYPQDINNKLRPGDVELFIISTYDSTFYIQKVGVLANIPADHVYNPGNTPLKLQKIEDLKINIFLDNLQNTVMQIDELSEFAEGILVDYKPDTYNLNPKWYQELSEKINRLVNESV